MGTQRHENLASDAKILRTALFRAVLEAIRRSSTPLLRKGVQSLRLALCEALGIRPVRGASLTGLRTQIRRSRNLTQR